MTVLKRTWALVALLAVLMCAPEAEASAPEHRVLASGQLRTGHIYRDRFRRLLGTTALDRVQVLDATLEGYQFNAVADLDLHVENSLSPDAIVDFTNRIRAEYPDPDDIQGGRYRNLDNRFEAVWGVALDSDTTMKTSFLARTHYDVLFPETNATTGDLGLSLDLALDHDSWITFGFNGGLTAFSENESPDFLEGLARIGYQMSSSRRVRYKALPSHPEYPAQDSLKGAPDAFRYGPEMGLHESKKLFPLGKESMIGRAAPAPLVVAPSDRMFTEIDEAAPSFTELSAAVRARDYEDGPFSDWRRAELEALFQSDVARGWAFEIANAFHAQDYEFPLAINGQTDRYSDRLRFELARTRTDTRHTLWGAVGFHRFPGADRFDLNFYEGGLSSLTHFGRRYWWFSDFAYVAQVPENAQASYPERNQTIATMGFTVDFTPIQHLTLSGRYANLKIPRFETFFDFGYSEQIQEARYHHQIRRRWAVETGARAHRRFSDNQPDNNRRETLFFLDTVLEL
jgi:hypothetical protein